MTRCHPHIIFQRNWLLESYSILAWSNFSHTSHSLPIRIHILIYVDATSRRIFYTISATTPTTTSLIKNSTWKRSSANDILMNEHTRRTFHSQWVLWEYSLSKMLVAECLSLQNNDAVHLFFLEFESQKIQWSHERIVPRFYYDSTVMTDWFGSIVRCTYNIRDGACWTCTNIAVDGMDNPSIRSRYFCYKSPNWFVFIVPRPPNSCTCLAKIFNKKPNGNVIRAIVP